MKIRTLIPPTLSLLLCVSLQMASAQEDTTAAREQAQSYFESGEPSKAVAVLSEAAEKHPQDHVIGGMLYVALRDHLWHLPQILPVRQKAAIQALVFNSDGSKLACGSASGEVLICPTQPLEEEEAVKQRIAIQQDGAVIGLAFSRDGKHLAVATRTGPVKIWDAARAKVEFTGPAPDGEVTAFDVAEGMNFIAIATATGAIQVLDIGEAKVTAALKSPGGKVQTIAFSHSGEKLVWNLEPKDEIGQGIAHEGTIVSVGFSYDDRYLLTGGEDKVAKLSGHVTPYGKALIHRGKVQCGVFNADATRILTCDDSGIAQLWTDHL